MYKSICVLALALAAIALIGSGASAAPATFTTPVIVARGSVLNHTGVISETTIFTPKQSGLYRLTFYGTITVADPTSSSNYNFNLFFTDATGAVQEYKDLQTSLDNIQGAWFQDFPVGFQATGGTPVSYSVTQTFPPDSASYSIYFTVERVE